MCRWPRWYTWPSSPIILACLMHDDSTEWSRSGMPTDFAISCCCAPCEGVGASGDGRRAIGLVVAQHGPQDAGGAGSLGDGDDLFGPAGHHAAQPGRALLGVSLHLTQPGSGAEHKQPSQRLIALLGDAPGTGLA